MSIGKGLQIGGMRHVLRMTKKQGRKVATEAAEARWNEKGDCNAA